MRQAQSQRGFNLIELMIVVAVIAILSAIALPSYQQYVVKTRRAAAAGCLLEAAQFMERHYTTHMSYKTKEDGAPDLPSCSSDVTPHYEVSLVSAKLDKRAYTLQAVPKAGQASRDTTCGVLQITHTGQKSVGSNGSVTDAEKVSQCF